MAVTAQTSGGVRIVTSITLASVLGGAMPSCPNQTASPPTQSPQLKQTWKSSAQSVLLMGAGRRRATCSVMRNATHTHAILMATTAPWVSTPGATVRLQ
jgi:hypothetical protein